MYVKDGDASYLKLGFVAIRIKLKEAIQNCTRFRRRSRVLKESCAQRSAQS